MNLKKFIYSILSIFFLLGASCTYSVHQVPISDFKPYTEDSRATPIEGRAKQFVIMGFVNETQYVNQAYMDIQNQCKEGIVTAIATKYYTEHGFFSWTNNVVMQGLCVRR